MRKTTVNISGLQMLAEALHEAADRIAKQKEDHIAEIRAIKALIEYPAAPCDDRDEVQKAVLDIGESLGESIIASGTRAPMAEAVLSGIMMGVRLVEEAGLEWAHRMFLAEEHENNIENIEYAADFIRVGITAAKAAEKVAEEKYALMKVEEPIHA